MGNPVQGEVRISSSLSSREGIGCFPWLTTRWAMASARRKMAATISSRLSISGPGGGREGLSFMGMLSLLPYPESKQRDSPFFLWATAGYSRTYSGFHADNCQLSIVNCGAGGGFHFGAVGDGAGPGNDAAGSHGHHSIQEFF